MTGCPVITRGMIRHFTLTVVALLAAPISGFADKPDAAKASKPNILFIAVDDLRPQLACYGEKHVQSPNIDALAAKGLLFERAFCMVPTCGASRASMMSSIRPSPKRFVTHLAYAEKEAPGITTLNTHLKSNGYYTISNGKVFHHTTDNVEGWSERPWRPSRPALRDRSGAPKRAGNQKPGATDAADEDRAGKKDEEKGPAFEISQANDEDLPDGQIAEKTIADLQKCKEKGEPFFIATGFFKPHLPFVAPKKYYDMYPEDSVMLPENYHEPKDAPQGAVHTFGELRQYDGVPKVKVLPEAYAKQLIRGYHACVSFTDAQIGKILAELDRLDLAKNTIVVLWGDHGWNLGEHTIWCKHSCFETSMRIPLIVRAPGVKGGIRTSALTESIDLYPTLCELTGIAIPGHVQGRSLVPLFRNPSQKWKEEAIGRFGKGETIRTDTHRFTSYGEIGSMLYDHRNDPGENVNIADKSDGRTVASELAKRLDKGKGRDGDLASGNTR